MVRIWNSGWVVRSVFVWVMIALPSYAQTNVTPAWLAHTTPPTTNAVSDITSTMDLLSHTLSASPWLDIALLKHAQLNERLNDRAAEDNYQLLRHRIANAPYFQSNAERARLFGVVLNNTVDNGINRIRLRRVRDAVNRYYSRYAEYPESLAKLAILGYTDMDNIHNVNNHMFRYLPQEPHVHPFISYRRFDLESIDPEPFTVNSPTLVGTSQVSEHPLKYSALIRLSGQDEPARVVENQTILGFFVVAVVHDGAIFSMPHRIIVLPTP